MRPLWKGALSFGLVNIPVKMYVATEKKDVKFRYLHNECMTPIQYQKRCPTCNREVQMQEIVYGYEYQKGHFVILNEEDFAGLPREGSGTVDILDFVDIKQVDPIYYDKSYYLEPAEGGSKAYSLLLQAMESTGKTAIARIVLRTRTNLASIRVKEGCLVLATMFYPDELRSSTELNLAFDDSKLHDNEIKMAVNLIENLSTEFQAGKYTNEYRQAMRDLIEAKIAGNKIEAAPAVETGNIIDLMEALKQSVKLAEKERKKTKPGKKKAVT